MESIKRAAFNKENLWVFLLAIIFGGMTTILAYASFFQTVNFGKRELGLAGIVFLIGIIPWFLVIKHKIRPRIQNVQRKLVWVIFSLIVGGGLVLVGGIVKPIYFLFPRQTITISVAPEKNPQSGGNKIGINGFSTDLGWVSFSQLEKIGIWESDDKNTLYNSSNLPASLRWAGRTGSIAKIIFLTDPNAGKVRLAWNNKAEIVDLYSPVKGEIEISFDYSFPVLAYLPDFLSWWGLVSLLFIYIFLNRKKNFWLLYALPMIFVWIFFLLIFYPGFFSYDAEVQWGQILRSDYTDWHPISYALLMGFVSKIYYSPASVVIAQILMVSIALAWGLAELKAMGASKKTLWVLAIICAVIPINIVLTITLYKDIPYSAALLVLSIIFLKIINTKGEWLSGRWAWLGLGFILGMISLFRINGLPVSVGSVVVLMVFFWKRRRSLAYSSGVFVVILAVMYGPIHSYLKVKHIPELESVLFLNHIAAHLKAGTPLTPGESIYLDELAPLDSWGYECCNVEATMIPIDPEFVHTTMDVPILRQDPQKPLKIALRLFLNDPSVDLRHMACAGELVWKVGSSCPDLITNGLYPLTDTPDPVASYKIYFPGIEASSRFPPLIRYANPYLQVFSTGILHEIIYSPAVYLYIAILCTALLAVRKKQWMFMLFLAPALIQSIVLFLINLAPYVRYQYGVVLVGLLSIGFLFVPKKVKELTHDYSMPQEYFGEYDNSLTV